MYLSSSLQGASFTFRRFGRKGYSLFAVLGREVKVGVLSVATLTAAAPCLGAVAAPAHRLPAHRLPALSDDEVLTTDSDLLLSEAQTTASRAPMAAALAARPVMTLSREQLAAAGITSLNDALKLCAGIDVRQRGAFGIQSDISINGGTFDQITILINGASNNNPRTGHQTAIYPLNLSDIERIEVLEGAASRVLGTQAFSGAINIVTRQGGGSEVRLAGGAYATLLTEARTGHSHSLGHDGLITWSLSQSYQRSNGAVDNSDFKGGKTFAQLRYESPKLRLDAQAGLNDLDFGANTFYSAKYPHQWESTRQFNLLLKGENKGRIRLAPQFSWVRSTDNFQLIRGTATAENFHRGDMLTASLNLWTHWAWGRTAVGAELREELVYSTNLGFPLALDQQVPIAGHPHVKDEKGLRLDGQGHKAYYDKRVSRTNLSYFAEHNVILPHWTISLGLMAQHNSAFDHQLGFYPGIDVAYRPSAQWRLFASWNKALRLPTFTDLFYSSPTHQAGSSLRPEQNSSLRLGTEVRPLRGVQLTASALYNRGSDLLDWVKFSPSDERYTSVNLAQLSSFGANLSLALDFQQLWGTGQALRALRLDYAWLQQSSHHDRPIHKSLYALEHLRHKLTAQLDHRIYRHLSASWVLRLQERNGHYESFDRNTHQATGQLVPYGTQLILDTRLQWTQPHYTIYFDLHNATDHRYFDIANVEQPGRTWMLGASYRF